MIRPKCSAKTNRFALAWILIAVASLGALMQTALRWRYEHSFGRVQIVLDLDDVGIVADANKVPRDRMLRALRARGATGVTLNEQTLILLRENGRISITPRAEALRLFPSLRPNPDDGRPSYLLWNRADARLMRDVESHLREQSPRDGRVVAARFSDGTRGLWVPASPQLFNDASLGYDWTHLAAARKAGLRPVALLSNRLNTTPARLKKRLDEARATGARLVLFDGGETPGYATLSGELADQLRARGLSFGVLEFSAQRGAVDVAEAGDGNLYRAHAVAPNEAAKWSLDELADRYARAARERNVRVLLVRLLRRATRDDEGRAEDLLASNARLVQSIRQKLGEAPVWAASLQSNTRARDFTLALRVGESGPFDDFPRATLRARFGNAAPLLQYAALWLCGLGVLGAWLLLVNLVFDCSRLSMLYLVGGTLVAALLAFAGTTGAKLLAFGAATAWPVVAFVWGGWPQLMRARGIDARRVATALMRTLALSIGGGLMVAAPLCDWRFLSATEDFWGTKPAQLIPLALTALLISGDFSPRDVAKNGAAAARKRFRERWRTVLDGSFTVGLALSGVMVAFALWLWMARSGNDSSLAVSPFEWRLRATLENWLMARPRNKELFGAYPAFVLSAWCATRGWKTPARALGIVAVIAPTDIINSFCQATNPLSLSLWRSLWGALLGGAIGVLLVASLQAPHTQWRPTRVQIRFAVASVLLFGCLMLGLRWRTERRYAWLTAPVAQASWPWPQATRRELSAGVTHWLDRSARDGTTVDLLEFDFAREPRLRFGLYDRDENDGAPFDNRVHYWEKGLAPIVSQMQRKGELIAVVNGAFFGLLNNRPRSADQAFHLAPVVLRGRVHYAAANHRWTFGTKSPSADAPANRARFAAEHLPSPARLRQFEFASGAAQCVVKGGAPLRLEPLPRGRVAFESPSPIASTPADAGQIRVLDWMKTSRVSFAWNKDSTKLWLLLVKEPDAETPSRAAVHGARPAYGGWTLADVQRFWLAHGADTAVVTDGGDVAQLAFRNLVNRRPDGWTLVPPRFSTPRGAATKRFVVRDLKTAPAPAQLGGALMYFGIWRAPDEVVKTTVRAKKS